jgi:hypothetical protein
MKVTIDWDLAESVFGTLLNALRLELYPYDVVKPPQRPENMPPSFKWRSVEHEGFLFCVCYYMRGGIESETAILQLRRVYEVYPSIFAPANFLPLGHPDTWVQAEWVSSILRQFGLNYNSEEIGRAWVLNFQKLQRFWYGLPSNLFLFRDGGSYEKLCERVRSSDKKGPESPHGYQGFQRKMVSMLCHFYVDAGIVEKLMFPVPVDFHVLRLMVAHKLLTVKGGPIGRDLYKQEVQAAARKLSMGYCHKHGVDPLRLGDALWLLSMGICHMHPGNKVWQGLRNGRKTILVPAEVTWTDTQVAAYQRSCGKCPVQSTCKFNIPSSYYYVRGQLMAVREREVPVLLINPHAA